MTSQAIMTDWKSFVLSLLLISITTPSMDCMPSCLINSLVCEKSTLCTSLSLISQIVEFDFGNLSSAVSICQELPKKNQNFWSFGLAWQSIFTFTKEFPKNAKENLPSAYFCSHLRQCGRIDLPFSPDCHIFIGVSENTHNGHL